MASKDVPPHRRAAPAARPPGFAARDAAPLHPAHSHKRAGPHLATRLNGRTRLLAPRATPHADQTRTTTLGSAGIRRYATSVAADNCSVLELLRGCGGLDPSIAPQASFGIVEAQITIPLRVSATSR